MNVWYLYRKPQGRSKPPYGQVPILRTERGIPAPATPPPSRWIRKANIQEII